MQRTKPFRVVPWVGGINTSVDSGVLNQQELTIADNVVFSSTGARIKRSALEYLDPAVPAPNFKSSSGTTRTLKWTTSSLVNITSLNERLVVNERITVTGDANYLATDTPVLTRTSIPQVSTVLCVADVSDSLRGKYFLISAGDEGELYYVWFKTSGVGTDPAVDSATGVLVNIATDDDAPTVASAVSAAVHALDDFNASVSTATVTITNAIGGLTVDGSAGNAGVTFTVTTKGGHTITYEGGSSLSESSTATTAIAIERASSVIFNYDYWRFIGAGNEQLLVYATDDFQLFKLDESSRRIQILGQTAVSNIVCLGASSLTTGDHFLLPGPNGDNYYVWINKAAGGGDPAVSNYTGIEVAVGGTDTATQVATAVAAAIDAKAAFISTSLSTAVTVTAVEQGAAAEAGDVDTGFTITTTSYGATAPADSVDTIRGLVINNRLLMAFSGLGNYPIYYNPDEHSTYQLLLDAPDASIIFEHQDRVWMNDKTDGDKIHYSPPFDETTWQGFGDSGAMFVGAGDGDPVGILNGYKYKDLAVICKKAKRYRMTGDSPENYYFQLISEGLGSEGPLSIPVDESDVVFLSHRGIHSQAATDQYGDTVAAYLSSKIKPTFNTWASAQLKYAQGAWIPELNSFALSIAEQGESEQSAVWLFNIGVQIPGEQSTGAWYRWPGISCQSLSRRYVNSKYKLVMGTSNGRLVQAQKENDFTDFGTTGIPFRVKSGTIYVDNDPQTIKAFKKIALLYRPKGNFSFTVSIKIDNNQTQSFSFNQISGLDLLGQSFVLGASLLGSSATLAPFQFSMDGVGRGLTLEITQPSEEEQIEVWGYMIEWEPAGMAQEIV